MSALTVSRRQFFTAASGFAAAAGLGVTARAGERPTVRDPRATDGDEHHEPKWNERLTITVGPQNADLVGLDDKVIQAAVDYVARLRGGTVKILPGTYTLRNTIHLPSGIRILGSGADSIITKIASTTVPLARDSDWYDQEITLQDSSSFQVGDGICLQGKAPFNNSRTVIKRTLVARSGDRFKLDRGLRKNLWLAGKPTVEALFPLLTSQGTSDVVMENITLDGNRENNGHLDGNEGGCIFLQDCSRYTIRNVTARNYNGDGMSWQVCHDVLVENSHCHDNADLGLHPGSGSQRPVIRNCRSERNDIGLFWCWGVKFGLAEGNHLDGNRSYGMSIGHNDTDNVMRNNTIVNSGKVGILFRDDARGQDFWANRNTVENNRVVNSGPDTGVAIDIQGQTRDLKITGNELQETREPSERIGIRIAKAAGEVDLADNTFAGFAVDVEDRRNV